MKEVRDTIKEVQYRRLLKRVFDPRRGFLERSRVAFLGEVAKRRIAPFGPQVRWRMAGIKSIRAVAIFAAVALLGTSGLVAFADSQNVRATHPLYPFKRLGEQVRLHITPQPDKHLLHEEFAKRRAQEVREISAIAQTETDGARERHEKQIKHIKSEFKKDIEAIAAIPEADNKLSPLRIEALCNTKAEIENKIGDDDETTELKRFDERCATIINTNNAVASSTVQTSPMGENVGFDEIRQERGYRNELENKNSGGDFIQNTQQGDARSEKRVERQ